VVELADTQDLKNLDCMCDKVIWSNTQRNSDVSGACRFSGYHSVHALITRV